MVTAPPVYDPGGPVALVLNLAEETSLPEVIKEARHHRAVLCVVNCPSGDTEESELASLGFTIASEWYRATLPLPPPSLPVRPLTNSDLNDVEEIAEARRQQYALYQPVFWRVHPMASSNHKAFLANQLTQDEITALAFDNPNGQLEGYVFAEQKGIDDFAVRQPELWGSVGTALLRSAANYLFAKGVEQFTVICGHQDIPKRTALRENGLVCIDCWWTLPLNPE
jgi:hypothetical protein